MTTRPTAVDSHGEDPIAALRRIAITRATVVRDLDRQEATAVRAARVQQISWQGIAASLGVSRQAVHRKYGRS